MKPQLVVVGFTVASLCLAPAAFGQADFTGSYSQNFDGLNQTTGFTNTLAGLGPHLISNGLTGSTGLAGWYGTNNGGSGTGVEFKVQDGSLGSSGGRGVLSLGANGASDRALGGLATSNQIPTFGLVLTNLSTETYASLDISYIGEQWRAGDAGLLNTLTFKYGTGTALSDATTVFNDLSFTTPNLAGGNIGIDGNAAANQTARSGSIIGLNWQPGQSIVLRWDAIDISGQDNGLAIDNLVITGVPVPTPGSLALLALAGCAGARRRRRAA